MRVRSRIFTAALATCLAACSSNGESPGASGTGGATGGANNVATGGTTGASGAEVGGAAGNPGAGGSRTPGLDGGPSACDAFGHHGGAQAKTFTLPRGDGIYYPDVQKSFPAVDWANITRLYVPAGKYKEFNLGNLPKRDAAHPLIITNQGGQVQVGPNIGANYIWSMGGGSNWILTGRYDQDSATGDSSYPGHRCGQYANTRGKYGFLSDDALDLTAPYLHMGISVAAATDFEIEFVEVMRSGFAGIRLLNSRMAGDAALDMANVKIHDNYIHDTGSEGTYFGWTGAPPANLLPGLKIYNNRIVRTGNEALQIQDLGDGTEVYGNVIGFAALHWRDNALGKYQDNNSQIQTRQGTISIHDNVFVGGAGTLLSFWSQPEPGDLERHVTFADNYFADTRSLMAYLGGAATAGSDFHIKGNFFRGMTFGYDKLDPAATDPPVVFQISPDYQAKIEMVDNVWEGSQKLANGLTAGNGTSGTLVGTGNANHAVTPIAFQNSGYPVGKPVQALEAWAAKATVAPASPDITFAPGDLVMYDAEMYECVQPSTNQAPDKHPEAWKKLPLPADDFRVEAGSPYAKIGVH